MRQKLTALALGAALAIGSIGSALAQEMPMDAGSPTDEMPMSGEFPYNPDDNLVSNREVADLVMDGDFTIELTGEMNNSATDTAFVQGGEDNGSEH